MRKQGTLNLLNTTWISTAGAAEYLGVSVDLIYEAVRHLGLRHVRVGGRRLLRFRLEWLDDWMQAFASVASEADEADWLKRTKN